MNIMNDDFSGDACVNVPVADWPHSNVRHTPQTPLCTVRFGDSCNRSRFPTVCCAHCYTVILLLFHSLFLP